MSGMSGMSDTSETVGRVLLKRLIEHDTALDTAVAKANRATKAEERLAAVTEVFALRTRIDEIIALAKALKCAVVLDFAEDMRLLPYE